jgi:hypothetical protein
LCQNWPGAGFGQVQPAHWFGPKDVSALPPVDLIGLVGFLVACYAAGTPVADSHHRGPWRARSLAPSPFVAAIPQAMLGLEQAASAVLGPVDRACSYYFAWPGLGRQTEIVRGAGHAVGSALEYFGYPPPISRQRPRTSASEDGWATIDSQICGSRPGTPAAT